MTSKKPKIAFVEQQDNIFHYPYPSLSLAYLMGACKRNKIDYSLVGGFTRYRKDLFLNNIDEVLQLLKDIQLRKALPETRNNILYLKKFVEKIGNKAFKQHMKKIFKDICSKNQAYFFNPKKILQTKNLVEGIFSLYEHYARQNCELSFVKSLVDSILRASPSIILFSVWYEKRNLNPLLTRAINVIRKKTKTPCFILFGGPYHSNSPVAVESLFRNTNIEGVFVYGEHSYYNADKMVKQLTNNLYKKNKINSLVYVKNNELVKNPDSNIKTLDDLPDPDFSKFELSSYFSHVIGLPIQSSRGCSWRKCRFCTFHNKSRPLYYSSKKFTALVKKYKQKYKINYIYFHDLNLAAKRAKEISDELVNNEVKGMYFLAPARLEKGYSKKIFDKMYEAGFRSIFWGLESGSQHTLNDMMKGTTVKEASKLLKMAYESGISSGCFLLFGFPGETGAHATETLNFLTKNKQFIDSYILSEYVHLEDSRVWNENKSYAPLYDTQELIKRIRQISPRNPRYINNFSDKVRLINVINIFLQSVRDGRALDMIKRIK